MKVEVVYESGQTYHEIFGAGTARISKTAKRVIVELISVRGTPSGKFTLTHEDAERLAYAMLLANSAADVKPIEFSVGEEKKAPSAA